MAGENTRLRGRVAQSSRVEKVFVAPGNAGTGSEPRTENIPIPSDDIDGLLAFAQTEDVDLTIVGPEAPLVAGIVDRFTARGRKIFGPTRAAAQLEGSKSFAKDFFRRHNIPTAASQTFSDLDAARHYIQERGAPIVVKADGLAAGKAVVVAQTIAEAEQAARDMLENARFGDAGCTIVVEDFLAGEEVSFIVLVGRR